MKQILYIDMDNVLVDFPWGIRQLSREKEEEFEGRIDEIPGFFESLPPVEGAIEAYGKLSATYDTYILSTAPWENSSAWHDKLLWVKKYLPELAYKRLILTHHKDLNRGDFLVDDRTANGADKFRGEHILFGSQRFPDWSAVLDYLL